MTEPRRGAADDPDRQIVTTRLFDAPRERVHRAWTDPAILAKWWGPSGFTNTFEEFDLRPGGTWRFVMHGPNGGDYPNRSLFVEVTPQRLSFRHESPPRFDAIATFVERGAQTEVTYRARFPTAAECAALRKIAVPGAEQMFDRLAAELAPKT